VTGQTFAGKSGGRDDGRKRHPPSEAKARRRAADPRSTRTNPSGRVYKFRMRGGGPLARAGSTEDVNTDCCRSTMHQGGRGRHARRLPGRRSHPHDADRCDQYFATESVLSQGTLRARAANDCHSNGGAVARQVSHRYVCRSSSVGESERLSRLF